MTKPTALISGAGGQDGSLLAELLAGQGFRVVGLLRPAGRLTADSMAAGVEPLEIDLQDAQGLDALVGRLQPQLVFHLAAHHHSSQEAGQVEALKAREAMIDVNFGVTRTLAFALLRHRLDAHLVVAGSSQMYRIQPGGGDRLIDELTPADPSTFYGHTKVWCRDLLATLRRDEGLRASLAVLFNHESPRRREAFLSRKVTLAAARAATGHGRPVELLNLGSRTDWSSADDVVQGLSLIAREADAGDWVLGSGRAHSVRELLEAAFGHVGLDWRDWVTARADDATPALVGDARRARERLGWTPRTSFSSLIAAMVDADLERLRRGG